MAVISITPANVQALRGAVIQKARANAAVTNIVGMAVYINSSGKVVPADADAGSAAAGWARGYCTAVGTLGAVSCNADDMLEIVTHGPVRAGGTLTPGSAVFNSDTAGGIDHTAPATTGDYPSVLGWALSDEILYVDPQKTTPVVV